MASATDAVAEVSAPLLGMPAFLAGSLVAAQFYDLPHAFDDADVFCPTDTSLIAAGERLQGHGFTLNDRFSRVWARWLKQGFKGWHTNSIKLTSPSGLEVNLVYKLIGKHPTASLAQVLESFDFGLLGVGYDLSEGLALKDMRSFFFPHLNIKTTPLPLMPNKRDDWRSGFISQYNGTREPGRYAKYHRYGYDLSQVKDDLVTGYLAAATYHQSTGRPEKEQLGRIYYTIADLIIADDIDELERAGKEILYLDSLDAIMDALE